MSLEDVASCVVNFSSTARALLPTEELSVLTQSERFLSIHSGNKLWIAILGDAAAVSKIRGFLPANKQQKCCAVRRYDST
jgi:hypothetical protein